MDTPVTSAAARTSVTPRGPIRPPAGGARPLLPRLALGHAVVQAGRFFRPPVVVAHRRERKDRRCLQRHRAAQRDARARDLAGHPRRWQGRQAQTAHARRRRDGRLGGRSRGHQHAHRRPRVADDGSHARRGRRRQGRSRAVDGARSRWPAARRGVPALGQAGQQHDRPAVGLHVRSHARRARGGHRGQAGRPGAGQGRVRASGRSSPSR